MNVVLTWIAHATALVACVSIGLHLARGLNAATRYCLWWVTMAAVLLLPTVHAAWPAAIPTASERPAAAAAAAPHRPVPPAVVLPEVVALAAPWIASVGIGLGLWRLLCLVRAFGALRGLRARCRPLPDGLEARLTRWVEAREGGRRARLMLSPGIGAPSVLGAGVPIIALPAWTIDALDTESLDLVVLHELAHVQRYDDRDLFVQSFIEAVFVWHPAVCWIGRWLNEERERACDDWVVRRTGRPTQYARCLLGVAVGAVEAANWRMVPGFGGARRRLADRVERVLAGHPAALPALRTSAVGVGAMGLAAAVLTSAVAWPRLHVSGPRWDRIPTSSMSMLLPIRALPAELSLAFGPWVPQDPVPPIATSARRRTTHPVDVPRLAEHLEVVPASAAAAVSDSDGPLIIASGAVPAGLGPIEALAWSAPPTRPVSLGSRDPENAAAPRAAAVNLNAIAEWAVAATRGPRHVMPRKERPALAASIPAESVNPWKRTADAGETIGRGAAHAGVKTAGFFSRIGRAVASSF